MAFTKTDGLTGYPPTAAYDDVRYKARDGQLGQDGRSDFDDTSMDSGCDSS